MLSPEPEIILTDGKRVIKLTDGSKPYEEVGTEIGGKAFSGFLIEYKNVAYSDFDGVDEDVDSVWVAVPSLDAIPKKVEGIFSSFRVGCGHIEVVVKGVKVGRRKKEKKVAFVFFTPFKEDERGKLLSHAEKNKLMKELADTKKELIECKRAKDRLQAEADRWRKAYTEKKDEYDMAASFIISSESKIRANLLKARDLLEAARIKYETAIDILETVKDAVETTSTMTKVITSIRRRTKGFAKSIDELESEIDKLEREVKR